MKGVGEGDITTDVEFEGKTTRIQLTQVMHIPSVGGKILSLKKLDQKGFEIRIVGGHIHIMKANEVYAEALLGGDLYEVNMKVIPAEESIMAAVKRDATTADLPTWHRRLGHLGDTALRKLITSGTVKGMEVTDTHLNGICKDCSNEDG